MDFTHVMGDDLRSNLTLTAVTYGCPGDDPLQVPVTLTWVSSFLTGLSSRGLKQGKGTAPEKVQGWKIESDVSQGKQEVRRRWGDRSDRKEVLPGCAQRGVTGTTLLLNTRVLGRSLSLALPLSLNHSPLGFFFNMKKIYFSLVETRNSHYRLSGKWLLLEAYYTV